MKLLKKIWIDLLITIIILLTFFIDTRFIKYFLYIYTPLILIGRIIALTGLNIQKRNISRAPNWLFHLLYAVNVIVLAFNRWWVLCILWIIIWLLAFIYVARPKTPKKKLRRI